MRASGAGIAARSRFFGATASIVSRLFLTFVAVFALPGSAFSQPRVFVTGGIFADVKRFSSDGLTNTLDSTTAGGSARLGTYLSERWIIDAGAEVGASATTTRTIGLGLAEPPPIAIGVNPPTVDVHLRTTNRLVAVSVLLGFRPTTSGRVHPSVLGGIAFMHVTRTFDTIGPVPPLSFVVIPAVQSIRSALGIAPHTLIANVPAATVGFDVGIDFTRHLAVVPELRAYAFGLNNGGPSGFAIRPGVGARWTF